MKLCADGPNRLTGHFGNLLETVAAEVSEHDHGSFVVRQRHDRRKQPLCTFVQAAVALTQLPRLGTR
jgi:hypothetical protein